MLEHVSVLGYLGVARALLAAALGVILLVKAQRLELGDYQSSRVPFELPQNEARHSEDLAFDQRAFAVVGATCIVLALLRLTQGLGSLKTRPWARPFGLGLAGFDILNLALFPLSTTLGLYGLVVWRHPECAQRFKKRAKA